MPWLHNDRIRWGVGNRSFTLLGLCTDDWKKSGLKCDGAQVPRRNEHAGGAVRWRRHVEYSKNIMLG